MVASGRLQAKPFAEERFNKTGVGAEPNEFDLWVNTGMYRDPMQLANHEMNHYTDYIISRNIDTSVNNNMLKQIISFTIISTEYFICLFSSITVRYRINIFQNSISRISYI